LTSPVTSHWVTQAGNFRWSWTHLSLCLPHPITSWWLLSTKFHLLTCYQDPAQVWAFAISNMEYDQYHSHFPTHWSPPLCACTSLGALLQAFIFQSLP
jgi:hypothetical protein